MEERLIPRRLACAIRSPQAKAVFWSLAEWLVRDLPDRFAGRILAIDQKTAFAWGDLMAQAKRRGIGLSSMDGLLAATASAHGLTLATRNTKDFRDLGVTLFDPW